MLPLILLAAGRGRRLRPHTDRVPKPLLPINGRPTLDYALDAARRAGIQHACLVTHHLEDQIRAYVGDGLAWKVSVIYAHQAELLGTGDALLAAFQAHPGLFSTGNSFMLAATDYALPENHLVELLHAYRRWGVDIAVSLKKVPPEELSGRSAVRYHGDFILEEIVEKPPAGAAPSQYSASLIFVLPTAIEKYLNALQPAADGELRVQTAINAMLRDGYTGRGLFQDTPAEWAADQDETLFE